MIFRVKPEDLNLMFEKCNIKVPPNHGESRQSLNVLRDCGYNKGLSQLLVSDMESGIVGDANDINRRQKIFGKNKIALPTITPFHELLASQYEDDNVVFLIVAASFYLFFAIFSKSKTAYIETLTIYIGVFFATLVAAFCDWIKESQFLKIRDEINNAHVLVYRGSFGTTSEISVRDLVVGDVIDIQQGDRIPADCILLEETNVAVDQSMYNHMENYVEKELSVQETSYGEDNHKLNPDPFLLSASKVMSGSGRAIVCSVGKNTRLSRNTN
jgi:magnesium-transporting ATPase (P-type)